MRTLPLLFLLGLLALAPGSRGETIQEWFQNAIEAPAPGTVEARVEDRVCRRIKRDRIRMIRFLSQLVRQNSGSENGEGIARVLDMIQAELAPLGFSFQRISRRDGGGPHLVARLPGRGRRALLVGHADTIFEPDQDFQGMTIEGTLAKGPGVKDMKGGLVILCRALQGLHAEGALTGHPVTVLVNGDEETGSLTSRDLIRELARESDVGLVYEGSSNGILTTSRGGLGQGHFEIEGVPAHIASREFTADANQELAEKILRILSLNNLEEGIHLNVAPIQGGIKRNQVSGSASGSIDLRFRRPEQGEYLLREVRKILSSSYVTNPSYGLRTTTHFELFLHRPPCPETPEVRSLAQLFLQLGRGLGLELKTSGSAGGSDQNLVMAEGVPCLDSLGIRGKGAHTPEEQGELESLVPRSQLTALALLRLWNHDQTVR